jgi:hypothetical protein
MLTWLADLHRGGGSGKEVVPDLQGKTILQAFRLLAGHHLCPPQEMPIQPFSPAIQAGPSPGRLPIVIDQDPRPGARVDRGTYVAVSLRARASGTLMGFESCPLG